MPDKYSDNDQRAYFRVEDTIELEYQTVTADDVLRHKPEKFFANSMNFWLLRDLQQLDRDAQKILRNISESDRDIATYLKIIDRKIELVAKAVVEFNRTDKPVPAIEVSISEGGLSFNLARGHSLEKGKYLALKISLLPEYVGLMLFARIVEIVDAVDVSEQNQAAVNSSNAIMQRISLAFEKIDAQEQHALSRHIMQVQSAAQRARLETNVHPKNS